VTDFVRDMTRAAARIEARKPRPTLSVRFNPQSQTAAEVRADRNYYRSLVL
jgi:hypothetical protein